MKQRFQTLCLTLLTMLLLCVPAFAAQSNPAPEPVISDEDGQDGIFQCGANYGPQTIPGQLSLMEEPWENELEDILTAKWKEGWKNRQNTPLTEATFDFVDISSLNIYYPGNNAPEDIRKAYETFKEVRSRIINEDPEWFFYSNGYDLVNKSDTDRWYGAYDEDKDSWIIRYIRLEYLEFGGLTGGEADARFHDAIETALASVNNQMSDMEKILALHDYVVQHCTYNYERSHKLPAPTIRIYNAYGCLVDGDAVCNGYTLGYKVLLNQLNIQNLYVPSDPVDGMGHAWNLVQIDNAYYHIDTTWDDGQEGCSSYTYFLLSDETFREKHTPYNSWSIPLPAADSKRYESGWIFNGSLSSIYYDDGMYYAVKSYKDVFGSTRLDSVGTNINTLDRDLHIYPGGAAVWHDGFLYYIYWDSSVSRKRLMAFHLDSAKFIEVGQFDCGGAARIGLRYENGYIVPSNGGLKGNPALADPGISALPRQTAASPVVKDVDDQFPIYYHNNQFYVVKTERNENGIISKLAVAANDSLDSGGTNPDAKNRNLQLDPYHGVIWLDGYLYYIDWGYAELETLMALQLETGKIIQVGQFDAQGSEWFGLRYDDAEGCITPYRKETNLASFSVLPTALGTSPGIEVLDTGNAAFVQADFQAGQTLWIARYSGGRMIDVRQETLVQPDTYWYFGPLQLDGMVVSLSEASEQVRAFLLDSGYAPVCPAA